MRIDLDAERPQLAAGMIDLGEDRVGVVHRHAADEAGEVVGMAGDQLRQCLVADARELA